MLPSWLVLLPASQHERRQFSRLRHIGYRVRCRAHRLSAALLRTPNDLARIEAKAKYASIESLRSQSGREPLVAHGRHVRPHVVGCGREANEPRATRRIQEQDTDCIRRLAKLNPRSRITAEVLDFGEWQQRHLLKESRSESSCKPTRHREKTLRERGVSH